MKFSSKILGLQPRDKAAMLVVEEFTWNQRREMLLFLTTNMAAVMACANQQQPKIRDPADAILVNH